ncbi:FtsW/RodA/SpoVE family cell cycle protein [Mesobacillus maritimus]|uniref:FtsW/RodA/SpoVE family cell cycle protein n=1 Tax=Mesobacillus maritimus TaxID=1643336 RepID=A0ABS7K708_9BACI|nr:FtsW/RodA/SpoVE family cell cycle protein [Mesobacillus maritimus]MBY0097865.1 FtsW/RodA/SpoVE family cell cycle protein [Mesobacillus maritimus]
MKNLKEYFMDEVLQQIKSKEARNFVQKELAYHLRKTKSELVAAGLSEEAAEEKAVLQMGSPSELGQQFNKLHRPRIDWMLLGLFIFSLGMGLLPILSVKGETYSYSLIANQTTFIVAGTVTALVMMYFDYRKLKKWDWLFLAIGLVMLLAILLIPNIMVNGTPYIRILGLNISSITALPFLFIFWASYFSKQKPKPWVIITIYLITTFLFVSLTALPVAMIYSFLMLALYWGSAFSRKTIYITTYIVAGISVMFSTLFWFVSKPYQKERIFGFLNPEADPTGSGYMYIKINELMTGGGWFGNEKTPQFVPELSTDFAFATVTYYYGWLVASGLVLVLVLLVSRLFFMTSKIKDPFGKQLVFGAIALFSIQFIYNIGMSFGLLPFISISLPFISHGLTPAVLNSFIIGVALSVYRRKDLVTKFES